MTVTARKLAANRANAKKSTGPRTVAGKKKCAKNAVTHGLFCNDIVLPGEDAKLFEQFRHAVLLELRPLTIVELMIVDRIVIAQWKLRRLNSVEASAHIGIAQDRIRRAREKLNHGRIEQFGTDEPDAAHEAQRQMLDAEERELNVINGIAVSAIHDEAYLERLSRHEQRLELSIQRNLRQLEKLRKQSQSSREDSGKPPLARCPFLPGKEYEQARQLMREHDRNVENRANESDDGPSVRNDEPIVTGERIAKNESSRSSTPAPPLRTLHRHDANCPAHLVVADLPDVADAGGGLSGTGPRATLAHREDADRQQDVHARGGRR
jgi:hypothetical protein